MTRIPKTLREQMAHEPYYHVCARREALHDHDCKPNPLNPRKLIEWEHALIFAGKQVQKHFAIVPLCWWAHSGPGMVKEINVWIALNRATDDELLQLSSKGARDYFRMRSIFNRKYGVYNTEESTGNNAGINYGYRVEKEGVFHSS